MISATTRTLLLGALALALSGCFEETSHQPTQPPAAREEVTGTVTDGTTRAQSVAGKGTAGFLRSTLSAASGQYALSLTDLTGPYVFANFLSASADPSLVVLTSVATQKGVVNITPLTTLLTAQVLGVAPVNAFSTFTTGTSVSPQLITDASIRTAQVDLTALLKDIYGLNLSSASFIDTPFTPTPGDPMFDAIVALNDKLAQQGKTLRNLASDIANGAKACRTDLLLVTLPGRQKKFCPVSRRTTEDADDPSITEYVFRDVSHDTVARRGQGAQVLTAQLQLRDGSVFTCAASACAGIALGTPRDDESRPMVFNGATLQASSGNAVLSGTMQSAVPGVVLPQLACAENLFYMVFDDRSVIGDCVSASDPFNLGGTFNMGAGPDRMRWSLSGNSDPSAPHVEVVLDTSTTVPTVVSVYYSDNDPETFERRNVYVCQSTACSGVTVGPATVNSTAYPGTPISIRNISFDHVSLSGYTVDGESNGLTGDLSASFTLLSTPNTPPRACNPDEDPISAEISGTPSSLCIAQNNVDFGAWYRYVYDNGDGTLQVFVSNEAGDEQVQVLLDQGVATEVDAWINGGQFTCLASACTGVSVSTPDGNGDRKLSLSNTVLQLQENFPLPGNLTLKLNVTNLVVPLYQ